MDWSQIIIDIEGSGLSLTEIGKEVGSPISTLSDLKRKRSKEPKGTLALALSMLHGRVAAAPQPTEAEHA